MANRRGVRMTDVVRKGNTYRGITANPDGSREERRAAKRLKVEPVDPPIDADPVPGEESTGG